MREPNRELHAPPMTFRIEVMVDGEWIPQVVRYNRQLDAERGARDVMRRWRGVTGYRVMKGDEEVYRHGN